MTRFYPDSSACLNALHSGEHQLVWTTLVADLETPVSAMLKLMDKHEPAFLLESVEGGETRGRYSIIGLQPDLIWRCKDNKAEINATDPLNESAFEPCWEDSLSSFKALSKRCTIEAPEGLPPINAGLIGYFGYDMIRQVEKIPDTNPDAIAIPDACFMRPQLLAVFDAVDGVIFLISPVWAEDGVDVERAYRLATQRIERALDKLQGPIDQRNYYRETPASPMEFTSNTTQEAFCATVEKAKEYIRAGDIFQVVPSQRFSAPFAHHPFALYRSLRHMNPSPFLFYLNFGDYSLVGSSPEILVRLRDEKVTIRPLAGTRKRGEDATEDAKLAAELLGDEKEIAEHLMLLDLGRNDVGRVAKAGTVKVTEQMVVERYSHVMHIVSNVEGEIDGDKHDAIDALMAGFPAGTVSGAPEIRAMEIIDELESERRSFYAGGVGYISSTGEMDSCITLRTALIKDGTIYAQAGAGVVADSDPQSEYEETINKAQAIMRAAEAAGSFGQS